MAYDFKREFRDLYQPKTAPAFDCDDGVPSIRLHHEILLGDPRRTEPGNLRTVIRHPVA